LGGFLFFYLVRAALKAQETVESEITDGCGDCRFFIEKDKCEKQSPLCIWSEEVAKSSETENPFFKMFTHCQCNKDKFPKLCERQCSVAKDELMCRKNGCTWFEKENVCWTDEACAKPKEKSAAALVADVLKP
jgi:hypothetical protein